MPQVTVVIPNYNGIQFLPACLDALEAQQGETAFEILVIDNGSTDHSLELIREKYPRVECIALPENTGFCHAVNVGIARARSPYVILLNNDTKVFADFIENLYRAMQALPDAFSVSARMLLWDRPELLDGAGDRYCILGWAYARGKGKRAERYDRRTQIFSACGGAAIYRKSILEQIGVFDERHFAYLEDLDLGYRAKIYGYKNYYEPSAQVIHYGSAVSGSRYNAWKTTLAAENNVYVISKNMPLLQKLLNLPFLCAGFLIKYLFFCRKKMGKEYLQGLKKGLRKSLSPEGRRAKTPFAARHLGNYVRIQWELIAGLFQFITKS